MTPTSQMKRKRGVGDLGDQCSTVGLKRLRLAVDDKSPYGNDGLFEKIAGDAALKHSSDENGENSHSNHGSRGLTDHISRHSPPPLVPSATADGRETSGIQSARLYDVPSLVRCPANYFIH